MKKRILYSTDGKGYWIRREWAQQCPHKMFMTGRCQGVKGHKGKHWCYGPDGSFHCDYPEEEIKKDTDIASEDIPAGHKNWVSPKKMEKQYYMAHHTDLVITDKKVIAKLEKDEPPEPNAYITGPVKWG